MLSFAVVATLSVTPGRKPISRAWSNWSGWAWSIKELWLIGLWRILAICSSCSGVKFLLIV